jgi:germination protein M
MKKLISIVIAIMILATGCSFIGQKDTDQIIPGVAQTTSDDDMVANASLNNTAQASTSDAAASKTDLTIDNQAESEGVVSGINSDDINSGIIVDNGAGEGVAANTSNKNSLFITLYYRDKGGLLVPVSRSILKQEGLAKAALSGLVDETVIREQLDYYGLYPVLPQGTKIKGLSIKNGNAVIDFSKEFLNLASQKDEQIAVASVVYTLTGFQTVSNVSIRVEGKELSALNNGTNISEIKNRGNTFINSDETQLKEGFSKCDLYYISEGNSKFNYLVPVTTLIEDTDANQLVIGMFDALSKKTSGSKYFTSFPEGAKLLSYDLQGNLAVMNFSSKISGYGGGTEKENSLLTQIYYTANQLKGVHRVKILIDGKETTMPEGTEVATAMNLPDTLNKITEK